MNDSLHCLGIGVCATIFVNADIVTKWIMACF
jgi:hypothetical protein